MYSDAYNSWWLEPVDKTIWREPDRFTVFHSTFDLVKARELVAGRKPSYVITVGEYINKLKMNFIVIDREYAMHPDNDVERPVFIGVSMAEIGQLPIIDGWEKIWKRYHIGLYLDWERLPLVMLTPDERLLVETKEEY